MIVDYKLFQSKYIEDNHQEFVNQCELIKSQYPTKNLTKSYYEYNIFSLTAGSIQFYNLFSELRNVIRTELPSGPLWMQAWINYHSQDEVLDWHNHAWDYHGYISITPNDTVTEFETYQIKNKIGQIYFGPGGRSHRVNVLTPFNDYRITIGYDVTSEPITGTGCLGLFPLL